MKQQDIEDEFRFAYWDNISHDEKSRSSRLKGKSLIDTPDDYVVIDLETTDLDTFYGEIIEFGAMRVENNAVVSKFETLVKPSHEISSFITKLTGITNEMVSNAPSIEHALPRFLNYVGDSVLIGHNVSFDVNFIYDSCIQLYNKPFSNNYIDTLRLSRRLFPEEKHHRLKDLVRMFNIEYTEAHRALIDVEYTNKCYQHMKRYMCENAITIKSITANHKSKVKAKDITTDITEFDETSSVYGSCFVFTGTLSKMTRREAMQKVIDGGGTCGDTVTRNTNYLVIGNFEYSSSIKGNKSGKQIKAEKYQLEGIDIKTISENVFYDMLMEV